MRPCLVIVPPPSSNLILRILQAHEPVLVQALLAQPAVKALQRGVVGWLSWPVGVELNAPLIGPFVHDLADELASVV